MPCERDWWPAASSAAFPTHPTSSAPLADFSHRLLFCPPRLKDPTHRPTLSWPWFGARSLSCWPLILGRWVPFPPRVPGWGLAPGMGVARRCQGGVCGLRGHPALRLGSDWKAKATALFT